uniref:G domain-containing protein n=1 Tax=Scleropages formosus TaxID=113540 RepID=A0A8C9VCU5_SCLFO
QGAERVLINEIKRSKPSINSVSQARILLVGPVGAGKSSFFNSISSVFHGYVTSQAISGNSGDGVTTQVLESFKKQTHESEDGKPLSFIVCDTMGLKAAPGEGVHVEDICNILKGHVPDRYQLLILSKVDEACIYVEKDIQDVYRSPYIKKKVSDQLGISVSCIFPVKNYNHETDLEENCDILLLSTLQQILHFVNNYFDNIYD